MGPELLVVVVLLGLLPAAIASRKGHSFGAWWFFGTLLFIVALPASLIVKSNRRPCPFCAEPIRMEANVCPNCHRDVPPPIHLKRGETAPPLAERLRRMESQEPRS